MKSLVTMEIDLIRNCSEVYPLQRALSSYSDLTLADLQIFSMQQLFIGTMYIFVDVAGDNQFCKGLYGVLRSSSGVHLLNPNLDTGWSFPQACVRNASHEQYG